MSLCEVAALPGIVGASIALPDVHSGYGFAIGNVAAFDMSDPTAVVSPGGVGFDINCGVRARTEGKDFLSSPETALEYRTVGQTLSPTIVIQGKCPTYVLRSLPTLRSDGRSATQS